MVDWTAVLCSHRLAHGDGPGTQTSKLGQIVTRQEDSLLLDHPSTHQAHLRYTTRAEVSLGSTTKNVYHTT